MAMKNVKDLNWDEFKGAIQSLNGCKVLEKIETANIRVVGVKKEIMLSAFVAAVDALAAANLDEEVPNDVAVFYNSLFEEVDPGTEKTLDKDADLSGEPEKKTPEAGAEKAPEKKGGEKETPEKKKEKDPEKVKRGKALSEAKKKSPFGHVLSAKSGQLDICLAEGCTFQECMDSCDVNLSRVKGHLKALKNKGLNVLLKEDKENPKNTHVTVEGKPV